MEPSDALQILLWVAVVVVYLGLAAVLREVRLLRAQVSRLESRVAVLSGEAGPLGSGTDDVRLAPHVVEAGAENGDAILVVADTTCPSCAAVLDRVVGHRDAGRLRTAPSVLTWESPDAWADLAPGLRVVRDEHAWSQFAHLTPPLLLRAAPDGRVLALHLPADIADVDTTLTSWGALASPVHESRGTP